MIGASLSKNETSNELARTRVSPTAEPTATLGLLVVHPSVPYEAYSQRLRELIGKAVEIAVSADFEAEEEVSTSLLPEWFQDLSDTPSRSGASSYAEAGKGDPWDKEDWIYCFDPDLRAWTWWDLTRFPGGAAVWIDTQGEGHVPHEELVWALYVAGASRVEPLRMEAASAWKAASR